MNKIKEIFNTYYDQEYYICFDPYQSYKGPYDIIDFSQSLKVIYFNLYSYLNSHTIDLRP